MSWDLVIILITQRLFWIAFDENILIGTPFQTHTLRYTVVTALLIDQLPLV